jgi:hypothetical protein
MKITEVIGSVADQNREGVAPVGDLMQRIANAFTQSGQVKRPLEFLPLDGQSAITPPPFSSIPMSHEGIATAPTANAASDTAQPLGFQRPSTRSIAATSSAGRNGFSRMS